MKRPFRFGRVQRAREVERALALEEFLASERVARQAEEMAGNMQAEIERAQRELTETRLHRLVPPEELLTAQSTLEALDRSLHEQLLRARLLRDEAESQRAAWERARSGVKTLERLEDRQRAAAREDEHRDQARAMDEAGPSTASGDPSRPAPEPLDSGLWDPPAPLPSRRPRRRADD